MNYKRVAWIGQSVVEGVGESLRPKTDDTGDGIKMMMHARAWGIQRGTVGNIPTYLYCLTCIVFTGLHRATASSDIP